MHFKIVSNISAIETIVVDKAIKTISKIKKMYGKGRWRKMKGIAKIELKNGTIKTAEIHWYEAHGKGRKNIKIKRFLK